MLISMQCYVYSQELQVNLNALWSVNNQRVPMSNSCIKCCRNKRLIGKQKTDRELAILQFKADKLQMIVVAKKYICVATVHQ